jgi:hypothetical protein
VGTAASAQRVRRSLLGPTVYGLAVLGLRAALVVAGLAAAYLLWGLFSGQLGQFSGLPRAERVRVLTNIHLAQNALVVSIAAAALLGAYLFVAEQVTGCLMALGGLLLYVGVPYAVLFYHAGQTSQDVNVAMRRALEAFPRAALGLFLCGGVLIVRDVLLRLVDALHNKPLARESLQYGGDAQEETAKRPFRLSPLGKCWEGPFCREFIRARCPIFHARKACWRVKRGCYCEEDIVNLAMTRISGKQLSMAPDARYNFANSPTPGRGRPELTPAQKRERCRHCVIYNEHQRQKYAVLMPAVIASVGALCLLFAPLIREYLGMGLASVETLMRHFSFGDTSQGFSWRLGRPSPTVEWVLIGALIVMLLSKALQALEWAVFKIKI